MANWHALIGDVNGNSYTVVYHVPIPSANNRSGVNYRTALVSSGIGGKTILPDGDGTLGTIAAAEKSSILAGSLFEVVEPFATNPGQNLAALQAAVDARWTALGDVNGAFIAALKARLNYFGGTH